MSEINCLSVRNLVLWAGGLLLLKVAGVAAQAIEPGNADVFSSIISLTSQTSLAAGITIAVGLVGWGAFYLGKRSLAEEIEIGKAQKKTLQDAENKLLLAEHKISSFKSTENFLRQQLETHRKEIDEKVEIVKQKVVEIEVKDNKIQHQTEEMERLAEKIKEQAANYEAKKKESSTLQGQLKVAQDECAALEKSLSSIVEVESQISLAAEHNAICCSLDEEAIRLKSMIEKEKIKAKELAEKLANAEAITLSEKKQEEFKAVEEAKKKESSTLQGQLKVAQDECAALEKSLSSIVESQISLDRRAAEHNAICCSLDEDAIRLKFMIEEEKRKVEKLAEKLVAELANAEAITLSEKKQEEFKAVEEAKKKESSTLQGQLKVAQDECAALEKSLSSIVERRIS